MTAMDAERARSSDPSLLQIASFFGRYANLTLGGGSATSAVMHSEIVEKRHWINDDQFGLSFALGRLTPGTNLLACCTAIGWILRGSSGAIVALLASSIPCAIMVVILTALFARWQENSFAQAAIQGAVAAAVGITVKTCWTIAHPYFKPGSRVRVLAIAAAAFLLHVGGLSAISVLLIAVVVGFILPVQK
ncbi:chromate transporter [Bradyrhizobium sp. SZCCHNS2096]|uniref:chromate transporter n=1 Tax=Bradyrhizobium sp. SZCCHNS2096 TaxID=3057309 RepID=UPI0029165D90|nr:chromate transporter [Bradyrhizobium sp. SZCCHNS2096]